MSDEGRGATTAGLIRCNQCSHEVPRLEYCVRCGDPLSDEYNVESLKERKGRFAAAPDESARTVALISTLFPQLPRAETRAFRLSLIIGVAIVVGLALLGYFPVALVAAAVLVPLLMLIYLWVIDIYEDQPLWVLGATITWGAATGIVTGLVLRNLPGSGFGVGGPSLETIAVSGIVVPLFEGALMLTGALLMLPLRRFNDVLDGATFGAAAAISFSGAHVIVQSLPILRAGLRPQTDPVQSAIQLVSLGVLQPVVAAGAIGAVGAAVWLRYRAPVNDRAALGVVGIPVMAVLGAAVLLVAAGLAKATLPLVPQTVVLIVLAAVALVWLRRVIHLGLLQESREIEIGSEIVCPNCGRPTPSHTFCGKCGVSLSALPRSRGR
ncbi:MAG TPA: hypothetical protein VMZ33_05180 [Candidatus Limnocylindrales bacterium]|nr:hypothetical protein [Candidatus Limnocylindrales bacterium]